MKGRVLEEEMKLALTRIAEGNLGDAPWQANYTEIKRIAAEALAEQPAQQEEPVVCKHEWFSTGAMETGQCRCIKCGVWNTAPPAQQEPVAWALEWTFNGEEVGRRLYDDETHCKFDAGQDGGVCRPLVYGDTTPQPPAPAPMQQEPVPPSAYESPIRDMTSIAARGAPFAEFVMQAFADAELRKHDAAPQPAQLKPVFSYTPDMDAVRRDEKEKADKFLAQQAQRKPLTDEDIVIKARAIGGLFDDLAIGYQTDDIIRLGREVEAAHGITETKGEKA